MKQWKRSYDCFNHTHADVLCKKDFFKIYFRMICCCVEPWSMCPLYIVPSHTSIWLLVVAAWYLYRTARSITSVQTPSQLLWDAFSHAAIIWFVHCVSTAFYSLNSTNHFHCFEANFHRLETTHLWHDKVIKMQLLQLGDQHGHIVAIRMYLSFCCGTLLCRKQFQHLGLLQY